MKLNDWVFRPAIGRGPRQNGPMATRSSIWMAVASTVLLVSCSSSADVTTPETPCEQPPTAETARLSELELSVEPATVTGGARATLSIEVRSLPVDTIVGAGVNWQCWNGSEWVRTHQVMRAFGGYEPITDEVPPGGTAAMPAIGLAVPNSYEIIIPDVGPGTYRIADTAIVPGNVPSGNVFGFVLVEVN